MGLNKHMMIEEHELEQEIARLRGECEEDGDYWDGERVSFADFGGVASPTAADLARADELERRLEELRAAQRRYNQFLDTVVDGKPTPDGVSPHFNDHRRTFERIQKADIED